MCGIVGYIGNENAVEKLHHGLKSLEYRGYDSAGIAFFCKNMLKTLKCVGCVDCLFEKVAKNLKNQNEIFAGIGHTRWATHGKPTKNNSHPHQSEHKKVCVVHNGIIENYMQLKEEYLQGVCLKSQTDTEIIANLIEYELSLQKNEQNSPNGKLAAIKNTIEKLKGSFALGIVFLDDPGHIYFAKHTSPLLIGTGKNGNFVASDILGFDDITTHYIEIFDGQFGYITKNEICVYNKSGNIAKYQPHPLTDHGNYSTLKNFEHYMQKEIYEIPESIINTLDLYLSKNSPFASKKLLKTIQRIKRIILVACGTSFHACKAGEIWLRQAGFDATSEIASEFIYSPQILSNDTVCIFLSQSGETADTLSAIKLAKKRQAKTIGITNVKTSTMAKICDYLLPMNCGAEISVASTKAYNTELCILKLLAEYFSETKKCKNSTKTKTKTQQNNLTKKIFNKNCSKKNIKIGKNGKNQQKNTEKWQKFAQKLQYFAKKIKITQFEAQAKNISKDVIAAKNIFMVGKNFDNVFAMEAALKLKEISYLNTQAYPSGELKHGTISLIDSSSLVFAFATEKNLASKTMNIAQQVHARGAKVVLVTPFEELAKDESVFKTILLPKLKEDFYPIISIIPMQLLAYHVSIMLGNNPDKPRNLAKSVTVE